MPAGNKIDRKNAALLAEINARLDGLPAGGASAAAVQDEGLDARLGRIEAALDEILKRVPAAGEAPSPVKPTSLPIKGGK